jgi:hypothetical protein
MLELFQSGEQEPHSDIPFSCGHDRRGLLDDAQQQQHRKYLVEFESIIESGYSGSQASSTALPSWTA